MMLRRLVQKVYQARTKRHMPGFDEAYYLRRYPDVSGFKAGPLAHYLNYGWKEGRDPSAGFSTNGYLAAHADVRRGKICPLVHFLQHGLAEGRLGWHKNHAPSGSTARK